MHGLWAHVKAHQTLDLIVNGKICTKCVPKEALVVSSLHFFSYLTCNTDDSSVSWIQDLS